jgi:hypothetical protein
MTDNEKKLLIALIMIVKQYLGDGDEVYNSSMSAGEHAFLVLEDFGLMKVLNPQVPCTGRWTEAGKSFIEEFIDGPSRRPSTLG